MYMLNNLKIDINHPFTGSDGTKYPHLLPQEYRDKLGVVEVPDPVYPDTEKFTYTENPDGSVVPTGIPLDKIQRRRLRLFRDQARALFDAKYDLLDVVLVLSGQAAAPYTTTFKTNVLAIETARKAAATAVNAATTATGALAVVPVWPVL